MSADVVNFKQCPVCRSELEKADERCPRCGYEELRETYFLSESELAGYAERQSRRRALWEGVEVSLRAHLDRFGIDWRKLENWELFWGRVRDAAAELGLVKGRAVEHAERLWEQLSQPPPGPPRPEGSGSEREAVGAPGEPEPSPSKSVEHVKAWVEEVADGEVDVAAWVRFLKSINATEDDLFLEAVRDEELKRQFDSFETVSTDAAGNLSSRRRRRVRQFVEKLADGVNLVMLRVPGGQFRMGAEDYGCERPVHEVSVPGFHLGKHPVTQAQWRAVARLPRASVEMGESDSHFKGDSRPAECVSWAEAVEFCARLSAQTGRRYRLPSEAEWEYACRAGGGGPFAFGPTLTPSVANYDGRLPYAGGPHGDARGQTVEVGALGVANGFGLCDTHGNVCEWCADTWHDDYSGAPADGSAWSAGGDLASRVARGGSWAHSAEVCRASDRLRESADDSAKLYYLGLRVALDL